MRGGLRLVPLAIGGFAAPSSAPYPRCHAGGRRASVSTTEAWMVRAREHCPRGQRLMPARMLVGSIDCSCGQAHHLAMRLRRRHLRGTPVRRMQLARRASARPPANLPGLLRAPTPVDGHLIDGRTSTDRDVLASTRSARRRFNYRPVMRSWPPWSTPARGSKAGRPPTVARKL